MSKAVFSKYEDGHFYLPILISVNDHPTFIPRCFVDCGATKCVIPRLANEKTFHLPIAAERDDNVGTGSGERSFDCITLPHVSIMELSMKNGTLKFIETDLQERDVGAWLGDDEDFVLGMSFLSKFDVAMTRKGEIVIER